jgi:hypothetical protein
MRFQIITSDKSAVTLNYIDKIAASFWHVEYSEKQYARPLNSPNWFDVIGFAIAMLPKGEHEWSDVIGSICSMLAIGSTTKDFMKDVKAARPFFDLIYHFKSLEFTPVSL